MPPLCYYSHVPNKRFRLKLKGRTVVFIDWANVYGWNKHRQKPVDPRKLYIYLKSYKEIDDICFYYGLDKHPKSRQFLKKVKQIGFSVITKDVKYIPVNLDSSHFRRLAKEVKDSLASIKNLDPKDIEKILQILNRKILRRKCDFDIEISMDVHLLENNFETLIFFSGDGDFAPMLEFLVSKHKQVIIVFGEGHLGREVAKLGKKVYLCNAKNIPAISDGA